MVKPQANLSQRKQCELLSVSRSSLYITPNPESEENLRLMEMMDIHALDHPTKGVLQMQDYLSDEGLIVNAKRIRRLLRLMGLVAIYPKRNLSKLGKAEYIHPYLLRDYTVTRANEVWAIDISYVRMKKGFMYLTAVIDLYSRYIVGWQLSNSLEAKTQTNLIKELILEKGKPYIINSDQGSQYTSEEWVSFLNDNEIQISMDGKGRATDNAFVERFFRTIKQEYIYLYPADLVYELREGIESYVKYYNTNRSHQGIDRQKPHDLYQPKEAKGVSNNINIIANPVGLKDPICNVELLKTSGIDNKKQPNTGL
jgi:putative transposase